MDNFCAGQDAPRQGCIEKVKLLQADLSRGNQILEEIIGSPQNIKDSVSKEPAFLTERLSLELWQAATLVKTILEQLERLHGEF